jgi:hypothetical protein
MRLHMRLDSGSFGSMKYVGFVLIALATCIVASVANAQKPSRIELPMFEKCSGRGSVHAYCSDFLIASDVTCTSVNCSGATTESKARGISKYCQVLICDDESSGSLRWRELCGYGTIKTAACKNQTEPCAEDCDLPISLISTATVDSRPFNTCGAINLNAEAKAVVAAGQLALESETTDAEFTHLMNEWFADSVRKESPNGCGAILID